MKLKTAMFLCVIAVSLQTLSCDSPEQFFKHWRDETKAKVEPEKLRVWATNIIEEREANSRLPDVIPEDEIFPPLRDPRVRVVFHRANDQEKSYISLRWGSGFGHWGILVGKPDYRPFPKEGYDFSEWKPGIYFWFK